LDEQPYSFFEDLNFGIGSVTMIWNLEDFFFDSFQFTNRQIIKQNFQVQREELEK